MIKSGSDLEWDLGFELGFSVKMLLGVFVGSSLGYSINMLLHMELFNPFGTWEGYFYRVSIRTLVGLIIITGEGYLVVLSLVIPLGYPL